MTDNPLKVVAFLFLIGFAAYFVATQTGSFGTGSNAIDWRRIFAPPRPTFETSTPPAVIRGAGESAPTGTVLSAPVGFRPSQLSPLFGKVTIAKVSSGSFNVPASVTLSVAAGPMDLRGWMIKAIAGSQAIGDEGAAVSGEQTIQLGGRFLGVNHDRILLFDARGLLVADYAY